MAVALPKFQSLWGSWPIQHMQAGPRTPGPYPGSPRQAPPADCHRPATSWRVASQKKPLLRSTPGQGCSSAASRRPGWKGLHAALAVSLKTKTLRRRSHEHCFCADMQAHGPEYSRSRRHSICRDAL